MGSETCQFILVHRHLVDIILGNKFHIVDLYLDNTINIFGIRYLCKTGEFI